MKELIKFEFFKLRKKKITMILFYIVVLMFLMEIIMIVGSIDGDLQEQGINATKNEIQEIAIEKIYYNGIYSYCSSLVTIVLSCVIVGDEYRKKTIKLLFIRPYKREKHYIAKFVAIFTMIMILSSILFIESFIVILIKFKGQALLFTIVKILGAILLSIPDILIWESICFLIVNIVTSTPVAMVIGALLYEIEMYSEQFIEKISNLPIFQYTFLDYWYCSRFMFMDIINKYFGGVQLSSNLFKSLCVCIVYITIFMVLGIEVSKHKDIKNQ